MSKTLHLTIRGNGGFGSSASIDVDGQIVGFKVTNSSLLFGAPSGVTIDLSAFDAAGNPVQVPDTAMSLNYAVTAPAQAGSTAIVASGAGTGSGPFWIDIDVVVVS